MLLGQSSLACLCLDQSNDDQKHCNHVLQLWFVFAYIFCYLYFVFDCSVTEVPVHNNIHLSQGLLCIKTNK